MGEHRRVGEGHVCLQSKGFTTDLDPQGEDVCVFVFFKGAKININIILFIIPFILLPYYFYLLLDFVNQHGETMCIIIIFIIIGISFDWNNRLYLCIHFKVNLECSTEVNAGWTLRLNGPLESLHARMLDPHVSHSSALWAGNLGQLQTDPMAVVMILTTTYHSAAFPLFNVSWSLSSLCYISLWTL